MAKFIWVPDVKATDPKGWTRRYSWLAAFFQNQIAIEFAGASDPERVYKPVAGVTQTLPLPNAKFVRPGPASPLNPPKVANYSVSIADMKGSDWPDAKDAQLKTILYERVRQDSAGRIIIKYYTHLLDLLPGFTSLDKPTNATIQFGVAGYDPDQQKEIDDYGAAGSYDLGPLTVPKADSYTNFYNYAYVTLPLNKWFGLWCRLVINDKEHYIDPMLLLLSWNSADASTANWYEHENSFYSKFKTSTTAQNGLRTQSDFMFPCWLAEKIWRNNNSMLTGMEGNPQACALPADLDAATKKANEAAAAAAAANNTATTLKNEGDKLAAELNAAKADLRKCQDQLKTANAAKDKAEQDAAAAKTATGTSGASASAAIAKLDAIIAGLKNDITGLTGKVAGLEGDLKTIFTAIGEATAKNIDTKEGAIAAVDNLSKQGKLDTEALAQCVKDRDDCQARLKTAEDARAAAEAAKNAAAKALDAQKTIGGIASSQIPAYISALQKQIRLANREIERLKADLTDLEGEIVALEFKLFGTREMLKACKIRRWLLEQQRDRLLLSEKQLRAGAISSGKIVLILSMVIIIGSIALGLLSTRDRKV